MQKGLLLVNLGTPDAPTTEDVHVYLDEFLSDPNVIQMPRWLWKPILHRFILPTRAWHSATLYERIWDNGESPLLKYTRMQAEQVQALLPDWIVKYAMTYRLPRIETQLKALVDAGAEEIVVVPLFPQYTMTTTKTMEEQVAATGIPVHFVQSFYDNVGYLDLLAKNIGEQWNAGKYDRLILSYHGIPQSYVKKGDPYLEHVNATTRGILQRLPQLNNENTMQAFQSKFGPMPWLKPYLKQTLTGLPMKNVRKVLVATPAFVADCIETIEEIHVENHDAFMEFGGEQFDVVRPFNDDQTFSEILAKIAQDELTKAQIK